MEYKIFCGTKWTMEYIAKHGAKAINPKTNKWQLIDRTATYQIKEPAQGESCYSLFSNLDLHSIAKSKGLII